MTTATTTIDEAAPEAADGHPLATTADQLGAEADRRTAELDATCRIPPDLFRATAAAGWFRQLVVAELGGAARTPLQWFRTGLALARHEASFAWVVTQGAAELGWIGAGADPDWAREVLADPLAVSASTIAGAGTLTTHGPRSRITGRWAFNTGCQGATWIGGLAVVAGTAEGGRPQTRWAWVPAERAEIVEDWDPVGLRGTGSHTTVITDQEIPAAWTFDPAAPTALDRGPYRCLVGNGNWPIASSVAAIQLGNARRALDEARDMLPAKAPAPDFAPLARSAAVQRRLFEIEGAWDAALASVERELESMWTEAITRGELSTARRVRLHRANATASRAAVAVVDAACELTGTAAVSRRHVLSRCRRDAHALQHHIAVNGASAEHNARIDLGLTTHSVLV